MASALLRQQFVAETFRLLGRALGAGRMACYAVDDDLNLHDFVCWRVPGDFHRLYLREMHACDPLHIRFIAAGGKGVTALAEARGNLPGDMAAAYDRFLRRHGTVDTVEMAMRKDGRVHAGISIMWTAADPPPTEATYALAADLHRFIEFSFANLARPARGDVARRAAVLFQLTRREAEVAALICAGHANPAIAARLGIGLATVKTHVIHILAKAGVENRTALLARLGPA